MGQEILIEPYMKGTELTCAILHGEALPIIGIRSAHSEWFDYTAKYEDSRAEEKVIQLPPVTEQQGLEIGNFNEQ